MSAIRQPDNTDFSLPILIAGGGGFIGGHLVADFASTVGHPKRPQVLMFKPMNQWLSRQPECRNIVADLRHLGELSLVPG